MSPANKSNTKLSRVTFNAALTPIFSIFQEKESEEIYAIIRDYIQAFVACLRGMNAECLVSARSNKTAKG